jgi:hypothetical protein
MNGLWKRLDCQNAKNHFLNSFAFCRKRKVNGIFEEKGIRNEAFSDQQPYRILSEQRPCRV